MKTLTIELLALDLTVCDRCGGTLANLREALRAVRPALRELDIEPSLKEVLVASEEDAERLRFVSSPTIRIDGRDVTGMVRESVCGACTEVSGAEEDVECRIWPWRGKTYDAAPVGQIVEAILAAALSIEAEREAPEWRGVPGNIRSFLRAKARKSAACCDRDSVECCPSPAQEPCCEPACCR